MARRLLLIPFLIIAAIAALASPAGAHNSLETSEPADGASLSRVPDQMVLTFVASVPLDTLTLTLIDPEGARTTLPGAAHGASGGREVVVSLPALTEGTATVRWRLVGPDGHAVSGRVAFTVPASVVPASVVPLPTPTALSVQVAPPPTSEPGRGVGDVDPAEWRTAGWLRWLLRYGSYLAIMVAGGILITETFVWRAARRSRGLRRLTESALTVVGVGALAQLLVIASDISGRAPWSSWSTVDTALETDAGLALAIRVVLVFAAWLLLFEARPRSPQVYWDVIVVLAAGTLATWSLAGHARSMRWPWLGVPLDVVHHGAAAAWIGGLALVGLRAVPRLRGEELSEVLERFSRLAAWSVAVLVATGLVQTLRLAGDPAALLSSTHGRILVAKVAILAVMLAFANANRRRITSWSRSAAAAGSDVRALRRAIGVEFATGLAVIGLTAAMVVSPPATADEAGVRAEIRSPDGIRHSPDYYSM